MSCLLNKTHQLMRDRRVTQTLPKIAQETEIPVSWLRHFVAGEIKEPSVIRVEKLYVYFSGKPLSI